MKIAVCVKQVPVVSLLKFDNETRRVVREGVPSEVNPFDVVAMSLAANLKETLSAEVVVYTMGPPQARDALVQCLAMGADRAVHLMDRAFAGSDTLATARALSLALEPEVFDLIICGRNSVDAETGQVGPEVAEALDLPLLSGVRRLDFNGAGDGVTAECVTDVGHDVVFSPLPALLTVSEDAAPEIYPRPEDMEAAQAKPVAELSAADLSNDPTLFGTEGSPTWVSEITVVESDREQIVVRDKPTDAAVRELMDYLGRHGAFDGPSATADLGAVRGPRRDAGAAGAIWTVAELLDGRVRPVTLELLGKASELAANLRSRAEAVLIGDDVERHAAELTAYGADLVYVADGAGLDAYDTELYANVLSEAIKAYEPYAVLLPSTIRGRDLAARVAGRLQLGLTGDCVGFEVDGEGRLAQLKPAFGGNVVAPIYSKTRPQMATARPGLLTPLVPDASIEAQVLRLPVEGIGEPRVRLLESAADGSAEGAELEHARVIVGVGKGIGGPENLGIIRGLADVLGASIGATRDIVELGWAPRQQQIGLSGKSVSPDLYIGVALRGAFNHTVGIQKSGKIVAINSSARAPIFKAADFGIVGDYAEVVPALTRAIEARRSVER